jgi:hypothetical protein
VRRRESAPPKYDSKSGIRDHVWCSHAAAFWQLYTHTILHCPRHLTSIPLSPPTILRSEFQTALGFAEKEPSLFLERVFRLMDGNKDGALCVDRERWGEMAFNDSLSAAFRFFRFLGYTAPS